MLDSHSFMRDDCCDSLIDWQPIKFAYEKVCRAMSATTACLCTLRARAIRDRKRLRLSVRRTFMRGEDGRVCRERRNISIEVSRPDVSCGASPRRN